MFSKTWQRTMVAAIAIAVVAETGFAASITIAKQFDSTKSPQSARLGLTFENGSQSVGGIQTSGVHLTIDGMEGDDLKIKSVAFNVGVQSPELTRWQATSGVTPTSITFSSNGGQVPGVHGFDAVAEFGVNGSNGSLFAGKFSKVFLYQPDVLLKATDFFATSHQTGFLAGFHILKPAQGSDSRTFINAVPEPTSVTSFAVVMLGAWAMRKRYRTVDCSVL